jgi:hypothetical protein
MTLDSDDSTIYKWLICPLPLVLQFHSYDALLTAFLYEFFESPSPVSRASFTTEAKCQSREHCTFSTSILSYYKIDQGPKFDYQPLVAHKICTFNCVNDTIFGGEVGSLIGASMVLLGRPTIVIVNVVKVMKVAIAKELILSQIDGAVRVHHRNLGINARQFREDCLTLWISLFSPPEYVQIDTR